MKNPTSISNDCIASLPAKGPDDSAENKARKIKFSPLKNPTSISLVAKEDALTMEIFSDLSDDDSGEENSIMENKIENPALNEQSESVSKKFKKCSYF